MDRRCSWEKALDDWQNLKQFGTQGHGSVRIVVYPQRCPRGRPAVENSQRTHGGVLARRKSPIPTEERIGHDQVGIGLFRNLHDYAVRAEHRLHDIEMLRVRL